MSERTWQESQLINSELGPRNEGQRQATAELTNFVNQVRAENQYRPNMGEREVQSLFHNLHEQGIAVRPQQAIVLDQWNRQVQVTQYVPFREAPVQPYYPSQAPILVPPPAVWIPPRRCEGVDLNLQLPLGNGVGIGLNVPLINDCRRERERWEHEHREHRR